MRKSITHLALLFCWVTFPILLGTSIYILWRPNTLVVFSWVEALGLSNQVGYLRHLTADWYNFFPAWIVFSLPNALWVFSYTITILYIWLHAEKSLHRDLWLLSPVLLGVGFEISQLFRILPGVFSLEDIFFVVCGLAFGWVVTNYIVLREVI